MSFTAFDIAGSGMTAQRIKMDTIASNIANINTTRNPDGSKGVYIKKMLHLERFLQTSFPEVRQTLATMQQPADLILKRVIMR